MGVFEHFPYVNFHELNLSWIINKLKELEDVIGSQIVDIVARAGVAANAQAISDLTTTVNDNAVTAHNEASAAQTTADNAQTSANTAQSTANTAQSTATAAQSLANSVNSQLANKLDNGVLLQNSLFAASKETAANAATVFFTNAADRYSALLFITKNDGSSSIYAVFYKTGVSADANLLSGTISNIYTDQTTGHLGIPLPAWSSCNIISTAQFT